MAKGSMQPGPMERHDPLPRQSWQEASDDNQYNTELLSFVHDTDFVAPRTKPTHHEEKREWSLKRPIGYLTVRGREAPVFAPIPGFDHLFRPGDRDVASSWSASENRGQVQQIRSTGTAQAHSSEPSRNLKRPRSPFQHDDDNSHDADEPTEPKVKAITVNTFHVGDIESLKAFYEQRFRELTMKPMRDIVTAWVKRLEPRRQQEYGPYQKYVDRRTGKPKAYRKPRWWPAEVPYVEPSHLKLPHLLPLAVDIMLVHRDADERKRQLDPWIHKLLKDATYIVTSKDTEHFSSSKGSKYNETMKKRALEEIIPSLFDIAQSHEDYFYQEVFQRQGYEGSGKLGPGCGKQVSWRAYPRPDRAHAWKRPRTYMKPETPPEDEPGYETEPDEEAIQVNCPSASFSSFNSEFSYTEDVKMFPEAVRDKSPQVNVVSATNQPLMQSSADMAGAFSGLNVGQSFGSNVPSAAPRFGSRTVGYPSSNDNPSSNNAPSFNYLLGVTPQSIQLPSGLGFSGVASHNIAHPDRTTTQALATQTLPGDLSNIYAHCHDLFLPPSELLEHYQTTHDPPDRELPTHGLPLTYNWNSSFT
ncbi:hypothetical protein BU23DRAFT_560168 [Bimuria novae-zelandiae CBS 107.79]|uniref:Subtelomeric hrmA-associated cluster protein AFUB-079030/YDR124W-like helical bundle domain-containing protein n=1 Tax=Bimuria novae-zelandiae CBS 107.79 TaxID=1447943 RepID=A0A6A5UR88_9PLEO|nr:hypothetical protein BU23DRAFT_560168 [Bimuria novae-zelandiae CBS 107.79]